MAETRQQQGVVRGRSRWDIARAYLPSYYGGLKNRQLFEGVEKFCMFIGYPRSGHSLVGSLLDAHPEVIIAHELDALRFVRAGFGRLQLYQLLLENSRGFGSAGRGWTGYDYEIPGGWQGRFEKLRVIGDKKGGRSSLQLAQDPGLLNKLHKTVGDGVRIVHVVRNPYDNVATMHRRTLERGYDVTLGETVKSYLARCETNAALKARLGEDELIDARHEDLISAPKPFLRRLCAFLDLKYTEDYLDACASIVFEAPSKSRSKVEWDGESLAAVRAGIGRFDFLEGYSYED